MKNQFVAIFITSNKIFNHSAKIRQNGVIQKNTENETELRMEQKQHFSQCA